MENHTTIETPLQMESGLANRRQIPLKKKSMTRLFSLSRQKSSKSRPTSPSPITAYQIPTLPSPNTAKPSGFVAALDGRARSKSAGQSHHDVLMEVDTNFSKDLENELRNIRSSSSTQSSKIIQNFSRHPRERKASIVSTEDGSSRNGSPQLASRSSQDNRRVSRSLYPRQSHETLSTSRPVEPISPIPELPSHDPAARPQTAHTDALPSYCKDFSPPLPRHGTLHHGRSHENMRTQRSPALDQWVTPWATESEEEIRASMRSGVSTWSSGLDSGSTKHSSVFTKMSSASDYTEDHFDLEYGKDIMTVDDAIELYYAGFEDDPVTSGGETNRVADSPRTDMRSLKIAEAMNDSVNTLLAPPRIAHSEHPPTSAAILSGEIFRNIFPRPPELQEPTKTHDQYGFRKYSREFTTAQYDEWHVGYARIQTRRISRWASLMKDCGLPIKDPERFPQRSAKIQRYIRKGIPPAWRGNMWFYYAGGQAFLNRYPDLYDELVVASTSPKLSSGDKESIERDLHRTFPDNIHFKPDPPQSDSTEAPLVSALRRVLSAFAIHHPRIGYCQSLNFIAGLLLLFLPEAKAFWMLHIITTRYLPGTHEISLEGANVDLWVLMLAVEDEFPSIWAKIGGETQSNSSRLPPISLCTTPWFMSLFIGTLPVESMLRVWDMLFYDGSTTIFRVALAIFRLGEGEIRAVTDPMETFQVVQTLPRKMLDAGAIVTAACRRGSVGAGWVEKRRRERKEWYAEERLAERARKESMERTREGEDLPAGKAIPVPIDSFVELDTAARSETDLARNKSFGRWAKHSISTRRRT